MMSEERASNLAGSSSGCHRTPVLDRNSPLSSNTKISTEPNGYLQSGDEEAGGVSTEDGGGGRGLSVKEAEGFSFFSATVEKEVDFSLAGVLYLRCLYVSLPPGSFLPR